MAHDAAKPASQKQAMVLPVQVSTPVDVGRLLRETQEVNETLLQLQLRQAGKQPALPKISSGLDQLVQLNKLNLLQEADRKQLETFLKTLKDSAPVVHVSFSADPSVSFMEKLVAWLRREIDPLIIVTVGLQPAIGVGCVVRTTNKQYNFSLRENFKKKRDLLREQIALQESKA